MATFPKQQDDLRVCPYNKNHKLKDIKYMKHLSLCPDRPDKSQTYDSLLIKGFSEMKIGDNNKDKDPWNKDKEQWDLDDAKKFSLFEETTRPLSQDLVDQIASKPLDRLAVQTLSKKDRKRVYSKRLFLQKQRPTGHKSEQK